MASDDLNEQSLQFKKRARRRLVGALALVLLMMIVLPLVLNDRSNTIPAEEIAISIPSQEQNAGTVAVATETTDSATHSASVEQPGEDFNSKVVPVTEQSAPKIVEEKKTVEQKTAEVKPKEPSTKGTEQQASKKQETPKQADSKTQEKLALKDKSSNKEDTVKAPAKKDEKKPAAEVAQSATYVVQIGVFSDAENVKKLSQKLSGIGFKSRTEKIETPKGEKIRLRTGPFASKDEAESALAKMKDVGLAGMIVTL